MISEQQANDILGQAQSQLDNYDEVVSQLNEADHDTQQQMLSQLSEHLGIKSSVSPEVQAQRDKLPKMLSAEEVDSPTFDSSDPFGTAPKKANEKTGVINPNKGLNARAIMGNVLAAMTKYSEMARTPIAAAKAAFQTSTDSTYGFGSDQSKKEEQTFTENFHKNLEEYDTAAKEIESANKAGAMIGDVANFVNLGSAIESTVVKGAAMASRLPSLAAAVSKVTPLFKPAETAYKSAKIASGALKATAEVAAINAVKDLSPDVADKTLKDQFKEAGIVGLVSAAIPGAFYAPQLLREGKAAVASMRGMTPEAASEVNTVLDFIKQSGGFAKAKEVGQASMEYLKGLSDKLSQTFQKSAQQGAEAVADTAANNPVIQNVAQQTGRTLQTIAQATEKNAKDAAHIVVGGQATLNKFYNAVEQKASSEYGKAMKELAPHMGETKVGKIDDIVDSYISNAIREEKIVKDINGNLAIAPTENAMSQTEFNVLQKMDKIRKEPGKKMTADLADDEVTQEIPEWLNKPGKPGITIESVGEGSDYKAAVMRGEDGQVQGFRTYNLPEAGKTGIKGVDSVYVKPEFRRQGIATKLTQAVKDSGFSDIENHIAEAPKTQAGAALAKSLVKNNKELSVTELNDLKRELGGAIKDWQDGSSGTNTWHALKTRIIDSLNNAEKGDVADSFVKMSSDYSQVKGLLSETKKITRLGDDFANAPFSKSTKVNAEKVGSAIDNLTSDEAILKMDFNDADISQLTRSMKALNKIADQKAVNRLVTNRASFEKRLMSIAAKREQNLSQGLDEFALLNPKEQETLDALKKGMQDTGQILDEYRVASNMKGMPKVLNDALKNPKDAKTVEAAIKLAKSNMTPENFSVYRDSLETQRKRFIALDGKPGKKAYQEIMKMMDDPTKDPAEKQEIAYMVFGPAGETFMKNVENGKALKALAKMEKMIGGDPTMKFLAPELAEALQDKAQNVIIRGYVGFTHPWALVAEQLIKAIKNPQKAIYLAKTGLMEESEIKLLQNYYKLSQLALKSQQAVPAAVNAAMSNEGTNGQRQ